MSLADALHCSDYCTTVRVYLPLCLVSEVLLPLGLADALAVCAGGVPWKVAQQKRPRRPPRL
eukprot:5255935-Pyramimonas_sp.AAC.1